MPVGLLGGVFDPPHNGHVALARGSVERFDLDALVVLVAADPGHKDVRTDAETRLLLARAAFPGHDVELDPHEWTIDLLRAGRWRDPLFVVGADQFSGFPTWTDPDGVLELARLAVATRPGIPRERLETVLKELRRPERVELFELEPLSISSSEIRERVATGRPIDELVPAPVSNLISELGLYRRGSWLH